MTLNLQPDVGPSFFFNSDIEHRYGVSITCQMPISDSAKYIPSGGQMPKLIPLLVSRPIVSYSQNEPCHKGTLRASNLTTPCQVRPKRVQKWPNLVARRSMCRI